MPIEIPTSLTPELVPFAWLIGHWEGVGVLGYGEHAEERQFGQIVDFTQNGGLPYLEYRAESYLLDEEGNQIRPIAVETGFWQLGREHRDGDPGPGLIPGAVVPVIKSAEEVEQLRNADGGFDLQATICHPGGITELYVGTITGPRVQMQTDAVMRAPGSAELQGSSRMFGLVNGQLMWAWDMAALGEELVSHASAQLTKVTVKDED